MRLIRSGSFPSGPSSRSTRGQRLLILLLDLLLLDLLLLSDLRVCRDLGGLAVEGDFRLLEVPTGICSEYESVYIRGCIEIEASGKAKKLQNGFETCKIQKLKTGENRGGWGRHARLPPKRA